MAMAGDPPQHVLPVLACDKHALSKGARAAIPLPLQRHGGYLRRRDRTSAMAGPTARQGSTSPFRSSCAVRLVRARNCLTCYRPLSWNPDVATQIVRVGGTTRGLTVWESTLGSPWRVQQCSRPRVDRAREGPWAKAADARGNFYDSDNFPTEARGSLAVPAVVCRSGRSIAVAKTDRLCSNHCSNAPQSKQHEQLATKAAGRHDSAGAGVLLLAGPCSVLECEGSWQWSSHFVRMRDRCADTRVPTLPAGLYIRPSPITERR